MATQCHGGQCVHKQCQPAALDKYGCVGIPLCQRAIHWRIQLRVELIVSSSLILAILYLFMHFQTCYFYIFIDVSNFLRCAASVEQHDVSFLKNRNEWYSNQTWIYKNPDFGEPVVFRSPDNRPVSPAFEALCYSPFDTTCHMCHCTTTPADTV